MRMRCVLAISLGLVWVAGCASRSGAGADAKPLPSGRFQMATVANPSGATGVFVLDTATGEVWVLGQEHHNDDFQRAKVSGEGAAGR